MGEKKELVIWRNKTQYIDNVTFYQLNVDLMTYIDSLWLIGEECLFGSQAWDRALGITMMNAEES